MLRPREKSRKSRHRAAEPFSATYREGERTDILLIDPPYASLKGVPADCAYNVGLTSLAAYVRRSGLEAAVVMGDTLVDFPLVFDTWSSDQSGEAVDESFVGFEDRQRNYERNIGDSSHVAWQRLAAILRTHRPRVVGIAYLTPMKGSVDKVAHLVKEIDSETKVVAGSSHPTFRPEDVMKNVDIDFVIRGEGEIPLVRLLMELTRSHAQLETVPGLSYRDRDGRLHNNPATSLIANLDDLPFLARDLVLNCDYGLYPVHCTSTTRGCPYTCAFCADKGIWGGKVRRRSVDNVIQEMASLKDTYTVKSLDFVDGTFTFDRSYVQTFCERLKSLGIRINWRCCARYDNLDAAMLRSMKDAGCSGIFVGLESGSDRVLRAIDKKTTAEQIMKVSEMVHDSGITSITSILLGIPGETAEDMNATLSLMKKIKTDFFVVNSYTPLPGSTLYEAADAGQTEIDWLRVSYESCDTCFSSTISREDFRSYLTEAREVANAIRNASVRRFRSIPGTRRQ